MSGSNRHNFISIDDETHINFVKSNCARRAITDSSISCVLGVRKTRTRTAPNFFRKNNERDQCGKKSLRWPTLKLKRPWTAISEWHCCLTFTRFYIGKSSKTIIVLMRRSPTEFLSSASCSTGRIGDHYTIAQSIHPDIKCRQSLCYQCLLYNQFCEVLLSLLLCGRSPSYRAFFYNQSSSWWRCLF